MFWLKVGGGDNPEDTGRSFGDFGPILTQVESHLQRSQIGLFIFKYT